MTEVVPVEPELMGQVQPEPGEQQTGKVDSLQLKLPLKRPDLKVALVSRISPATEGVVQYFCNLARSVSDLCPTVGIANLDRGPPPPELDSRLDMRRVWRLNSLAYPFRIFKACLKLRPKVVHINHDYMMYGRPFYGALMPLLLLLLRVARRPTVLTLHSVVPLETIWNGFFKRYGSRRLAPLKIVLFLAWTRIMLRLANQIIIHSRASKSILSNEYGYPIGNISVIGHPIPQPMMMSRSSAKEILGFEGRTVVLNFGYIHEKKGIEYSIRAMGSVMRAHPDSLLVIAGGPHVSHSARPNDFLEYLEKLKRTVNEVRAENNVVFRAEYIPSDLIQMYFSAADIVVLPYVEQFGASGVMARAMAEGKPVVASRLNSFLEIIRDGVNGLLVDPASPGQLSDAIIRLLDSSALRDSLGNSLKNSARDLWWPEVAKMHVEVYSRIADKVQAE